MLRSLRANTRLLVTLLAGALVIVLVVGFDGLNRISIGLMAQAFQSPIQTPTPPPYPPPPTPAPSPTPPATCPPQIRWRPFEAEMEVEGLPGAERAMLRMQPVLEEIGVCLAERGVTLPEMAFGNGRHRLQLQEIPDGAYYKLELQAPPSYFRDPAGYLFQVQDGQIVRRPGFVFRFRLVLPAEQDLPPCREFEQRVTSLFSSSIFGAGDMPADVQRAVCRAERVIDVSASPKLPERPYESGVLNVGYHYAGPMTFQDNQGVWGRNHVVDPNVGHPGTAHRFVTERVYADSGTSWMEAGWAEVWWRDDEQYIYEYDSATQTWHFFDQYELSPGSVVEMKVEYRPDVGTWWALYYLGGPYWAVLAEESLGFTTADHGYNRGEVYTADGVHPILPISGFDKGYLKIDDIWRIWNDQYSAQTRIDADPPYQVDMISRFYRFNIHSPLVFIPLVLNNTQ